MIIKYNGTVAKSFIGLCNSPIFIWFIIKSQDVSMNGCISVKKCDKSIDGMNIIENYVP